MQRRSWAKGLMMLWPCWMMPCAMTAAADWRLDEAVTAPSWLSIGGTYRWRYESLDQPFRRGATGSDQILAQRLLLAAEARGDAFYAGIELEDARAWLDDTGTPMGTDDVNVLEPLQVYAGWRGADVLSAGDQVDVAAGRLTLDVGSRRLVARNRFRNTLNAFSGVRASWLGAGGGRVQAFVMAPLQRLPLRPERLRGNEQRLDEEARNTWLWGAFAGREALWRGLGAELYLLGLHQSSEIDRDLYTLGGRLLRAPAPGAWDLELEAALQFGRSQDLPSAVLERQDVAAGFVHLAMARTFHGRWAPRLVGQLDYASGDDDPADGSNNRFDTLFGARRFDFGPTGIYGALARSNILSPGVTLELEPGPRSAVDVGYRAVWLASRRDLLATALLRDPQGDSGRFVGQQLEARLRFTPGTGNLQLEAGGAYLRHGRFLEDAPGGVGEGSTRYVYLETTVTF